MRFQFLMQSDKLTEIEKNQYMALVNTNKAGVFTMPDEVLKDSLQMLSQLLQRHYDQRVVILIDEYDVPLDKAFSHKSIVPKQRLHLIVCKSEILPEFPQNYWVNTSNNSIIRSFLGRANATTKNEIEQLINRKSVKKRILRHPVNTAKYRLLFVLKAFPKRTLISSTITS